MDGGDEEHDDCDDTDAATAAGNVEDDGLPDGDLNAGDDDGDDVSQEWRS